MCEGQDTAPAAGEQPLHDGVGTGIDNDVRLDPFTVTRVECPASWDPSSDRLPVTYHLRNPNRRARRGRIVYDVPVPENPDDPRCRTVRTTVHTMPLRSSQLTHGEHELVESDRWDGTITEGLTDRNGERVMADLSRVGVTVEAWDHDGPEPGREGEYVSSAQTRVAIDTVAEAAWGAEWCIPEIRDFGEAQAGQTGQPAAADSYLEPERGRTSIRLRVRNVREATAVRILVARISDRAATGLQPEGFYALTRWNADRQPGLEGATVQGGQVLLADGSEPYVRFNNYGLHWTHENETDFYCFYVAFGERGSFQAASELDYVAHESECLHMKFTVFVHAPARSMGYSRDAARHLEETLREQTRYFRCYKMLGAASTPVQWRQYASHRYIVIILSHATCECGHPSHGTYRQGGRTKPLRLYREGFAPDQNVCPETGRPSNRTYGGCGNKPGVQHFLKLGRFVSGRRPWSGRELNIGNVGTWDGSPEMSQDDEVSFDDEDAIVASPTTAEPTDETEGETSPPDTADTAETTGDDAGEENLGDVEWLETDEDVAALAQEAAEFEMRRALLFEVKGNAEHTRRVPMEDPDTGIWGPVFWFHAGSCRTILTTNLAEYFVNSGTKFYSGWTYVSSDSLQVARLTFDCWLAAQQAEADGAEPAPYVENSTEAFIRAFQAAAGVPAMSEAHPRLVDESLRLVSHEQLTTVLE